MVWGNGPQSSTRQLLVLVHRAPRTNDFPWCLHVQAGGLDESSVLKNPSIHQVPQGSEIVSLRFVSKIFQNYLPRLWNQAENAWDLRSGKSSYVTLGRLLILRLTFLFCKLGTKIVSGIGLLRRLKTFTQVRYGFPGDSVVKNLPANAGDLGSVSGSGRSPGEGNGNPLQFSCPEDSTDRGDWRPVVHGVARVRHDLATEQHTGKVPRKVPDRDQPPKNAGCHFTSYWTSPIYSFVMHWEWFLCWILGLEQNPNALSWSTAEAGKFFCKAPSSKDFGLCGSCVLLYSPLPLCPGSSHK